MRKCTKRDVGIKERGEADEAVSEKCLASLHPHEEHPARGTYADVPGTQSRSAFMGWNLAKFYIENVNKRKYRSLYLDAKIPAPRVQDKD